MAVKESRPTTPLRRGMTMVTFEEITTDTPGKSLLVSLNKSGSRNVQGKITARRHGGGAKRKYRTIDFERNKGDVPTRVVTIEYDPDRIAYIALVVYVDDEKRYIIASVGLKVGGAIVPGPDADIKAGNAPPLKNIPVDTFVHSIELQIGKDAQMVGPTGTIAQLMAKEGNYTTLRLPSGEMRYVRIECRATISTVSSITNDMISIGKAGRKRHMRWRSTVRGSIVNPDNYPHGDGEGRSPINRPNPVTPWGKPVLGYKTRKNKKYSGRLIMKRRNGK